MSVLIFLSLSIFSSDDNDEFLSILLNQPNFHTRQSKRKKIADDFEQEMTKELNETMDSLHGR